MALDKYCKRCRFRGRTGAELTCDYILITGHRRPCPVGQGCTVRETGPKERSNWPFSLDGSRPKEGPTPQQLEPAPLSFNVQVAQELYDQGLSDPKIAAEVGVSPRTIAAWRKRNCMPPNVKRRGGWGHA